MRNKMLSLCTVLGIIFSLLISTNAIGQEPYEQDLKTFSDLLKTVNEHYVDSINNSKLIQAAVEALLEELDPHSVYIPAKDRKRMNEPLVGNFEGIGIQFNILRDTILVVSPISGGPSEKLGILPGDKIIKIDDTTVAGVEVTNLDVMRKLRGKKGTKVVVSILRRDEKELLDFEIIRDKIPLLSVDATYMATPEIGYIKINRFAQKTHQEFMEGLAELKEDGMKHLILDLRGNGGGYLESAFRVADEFLEKNKMIVYTRGMRHRPHEYRSTDRGFFKKGKLVVLIDEGSASASEIVAGAMQDWDRGLIIGRKSFGKGLVQNPFGLSDGSELRLTTARYYTPSGRCIQKPYENGKDEYVKEISSRMENGELFNADSISLPDSLKFRTSKNRIVFGGGGIMPDIFMPLDTSEYTDYYGKLVRRGIFNQFVLSYLDANRDSLLKEYPTFENYHKSFDPSVGLIDDFISFSEKNKIEKNQEELEISQNLINYQLKALFADNLWSDNEYYRIWNERDKVYQKAIESIESNVFNKSGLSYK